MWMQTLNYCIVCFLFLLCCSVSLKSPAADWSRRSGIEMAGTRFEFHWQSLMFKGRPLPEGIEVLVCPLGRFYFRKRIFRRAGVYGWVLEKGPEPAGGFSSQIPLTQPVRATTASRYWYSAPLRGKRIDTPTFWVWVRVAGIGYWVNPDGLDYFVPIWRASGKSKEH